MKLAEKELNVLLETINHRVKHFDRDEFRRMLTKGDKAYYMNDKPRGEDTESEEYSRYEEVGMGLVNPAVEAEVAFLNALFLSDPNIFSVVSDNKYKNLAKAIKAINVTNAIHAKWSKELLKFFRDNAKYNLGFLLCLWDAKQTYGSKLSADFKSDDIVGTIWQGTRLTRLDPYNVAFDQNVDLANLAEDGEFFAYVNTMTQAMLYRKIETLKALATQNEESSTEDNLYNQTKEMWSSSISSVSENFKYEEAPTEEILPSFNSEAKIEKTHSWLEYAGVEADSVNKKIPKSNALYNVATVYLRLIPALYGFNVADSGVLQIWEIIIVNGDYIVHVSRKTNAHDFLPVAASQPVEDSLGINSQGFATVIHPLQKLGKQLIDRKLASLDRNINDKAIYDSKAIDGDHLKSKYSDAKIPLKPTATEIKSLDQIYMQIPFTDTSAGLMNNEFNMVREQSDELSGINKASRGQFVKGNKTLQEYQDIMSNADSKQYTRAGAIESQALSTIKHIIKWDLMQYVNTETIVDPMTGEEIQLDETEMRTAVFNFKLSDGLNPASKFLNSEETLGLFQLLTQISAQAQATGQPVPNMMDLLTHILQQGKNIDLTQYMNQAAPPAEG